MISLDSCRAATSGTVKMRTKVGLGVVRFVFSRHSADSGPTTLAIQLAALGKVRCEFVTKELKDLPQIYEDMHTGKMASL
jgi:hypothetical protein